jgi:outer membrane protein TolC
MKKCLLRGTLAVYACLMGSAAAHAESPAPLTLESLIAEVERQNPELLAKQAVLRAVKERPAQARALDDPMFMIELWQAPINLSQVPLMFTLRQPIPGPGKLSARAAVAELDAKSAQAGSDSTRRRLRLEAARAYYSYKLAVRSDGVLRETQQLLNLVVGAVSARYRVGRAELSELLKAQEALASSDNLLLDVAQERELAESSLNTLLARPPTAPLGMPASDAPLRPLPDESVLIARAFADRPEVQAVRAELEQAQARVHAARSERAPDLAVWASFMAMLRGGSDHTFTIGLQTTLPSFSLLRYGAQEREALAMAASQRARLRQLEAQLADEVHVGCLRINTAARHIRLHADSLIPLSEKAVRAAQAGYQSGRIELVFLLDTAKMLVAHQLDHARYSAEYGQRLAELEAAIGGPLWSESLEGDRR